MIKQGTWVQIHKIILSPTDRPQSIPEDTKRVPLEMWVKGYLLADANLGSSASIQTITGRIETGEIVNVNPAFQHSFGEYIPEMAKIDLLIKAAFASGEGDE